MFRILRKKFSGLRTILLIFLRNRRYLFGKHRLPPGKLIPIYEREKQNRNLLLEIAQEKGPIFKARRANTLMICIVGLQHCVQFVKEHSANTHMATVDLRSLFPHGFLRQMEGEIHSHYRNALINGLAPDLMDQNQETHISIVEEALEKFRLNASDSIDSAKQYRNTLIDIATGLLIHTFFGYSPKTEEYSWLIQRYQGLGKDHYNWNIEDAQKKYFNEIRDYLLQKLENPSGIATHSILGHMAALASIDETSLGNLIYMVEMGRHDMRGLFHWLSKYGSENPELMAEIRLETLDFSSERMTHT